MASMYSAKLLDHFEHPRNAGDVPEATAIVQQSNPVCGDVLRFSARVVNGRIEEIRFRAKGCVPAMACASALTELVCGREVNAARGLSREEVEKAVDGVPEASGHASQLAVEGLRKLLEEVKDSLG
jgi:nitrogen fixation protein NifU and related proteins